MPQTQLKLYCDGDEVPVLDWLADVPTKARDKCRRALARLRDEGHALRRPAVAPLRDGVHELRVGLRHQNYRLLYFFEGTVAVVVSHGLTKEQRVPPREIDLAVARRRAYLADPAAHAYIDDSYAYLHDPEEDAHD